jgi:hypothetical protein
MKMRSQRERSMRFTIAFQLRLPPREQSAIHLSAPMERGRRLDLNALDPPANALDPPAEICDEVVVGTVAKRDRDTDRCVRPRVGPVSGPRSRRPL